MSTLPSKPISFLAQIGVIGLGKCKLYLKCPPHLILEFPAHFYELLDDVSPATPYVGSIEVDTSLAILDESRDMNNDINSSKKKHENNGYRLPPKGQLQIVNYKCLLKDIKLF